MSKEIKIGIDVSRANRECRGIPIYTRSILKEFGSANANYQFVLLHYPDSKPNTNFGIQNAQLEAIPYSGKYVSWLRILQEQVIYPIGQTRLALDVIWHPQNHGQFLTPVGYVCTLHDVLPISRPDLSQDLDSLESETLYRSRTRTTSRADMVITVSEFSRAEIIKYLHVNPAKITAIHNGIDHSTFRPEKSVSERQRLKTLYKLPDNYLLTVGSYAPHKNLRVLLESFVRSDLPKSDVGLVMVGPKDEVVYTSEHQRLENYARDLGILDKVMLLPAVPVHDLVGLYNNAMMFAITSEYEGFGFPPLEAMACGVPVVASNSSSLPEICSNATLYANSKDSEGFARHFNDLLMHTELRQQMVNLGIQQASKFEWKTTAEKTLKVLGMVATK